MRTTHTPAIARWDRCYTPRELARALHDRMIDRGLLSPSSIVLDAGVGNGAYYDDLIARGIARGIACDTVDIDPDAPALVRSNGTRADFLAIPTPTTLGQPGHRDIYDIVDGNPPYTPAELFIRKGLEIAPVVSFLLPLLFLGSAGRFAAGLWDQLAVVDPLVERAGFDGPDTPEHARKKTGMGQHALFVFLRGHSGGFQGQHIAWGGCKGATW